MDETHSESYDHKGMGEDVVPPEHHHDKKPGSLRERFALAMKKKGIK
jgi:hypothetical protein